MANSTDIAAQFEAALRADKVRHYKKMGHADIRPAVAGERVATILDGKQETVNTAGPDDYVVRGVMAENYIIKADTLAKRYGAAISGPDGEGYRRYPAKGEIYAFRYEGEPFTFIAPWKEEMIANPGDYIGTNVMGSREFYRIEKNAFAATYAAAAD